MSMPANVLEGDKENKIRIEKILETYLRSFGSDYYEDPHNQSAELQLNEAERLEKVNKFEIELKFLASAMASTTGVPSPIMWAVRSGARTWGGMDNGWRSRRKVPILSLPLAAVQKMAAVPNSQFDISVLAHCYYELYDFLWNRNDATSLHDTFLNVSDFLETVTFLLGRKEIQAQLNTLPVDATLDNHAREYSTVFTQEAFAKLVFLCRELGETQGREIFEENKARMQVTPELFTSMMRAPLFRLTPEFNESFAWCMEQFQALNPGKTLENKALDAALEAALRAYSGAIWHDMSVVEASEQVRQLRMQSTTDLFETYLKRLRALSLDFRWARRSDTSYFTCGGVSTGAAASLLYAVLPFKGLQIMYALQSGVFDVSLLKHYGNALAYCASLKDRKVSNFPDIVNAIGFLLNQKEIQEQLNTLPAEAQIDQNAGWSFTQEQFAKILFSCRELGGDQGLAIFNQNSEKIQVTSALLASIMTLPCCSDDLFAWCLQKWRDSNSGQTLSTDVVNRILQQTFEDYLNALGHRASVSPEQREEITARLRTQLQRLLAVSSNLTWAVAKTYFDLADARGSSETEMSVLQKVLPFQSLTIMYSLRPAAFDLSLLKHYSEALQYCQYSQKTDSLQDKKISNMPDMIEAIGFLLEQKEIQEQLKQLPKEGRLYENASHSTFTQEEFDKFLFACCKSGGEQGRAIFEKYSEKIQVTSTLIASIMTLSCSDHLFNWCVSRWQELNSNQKLPKEILQNSLTEYSVAMGNQLHRSSAEASEKIQAITARFTAQLTRIMAFNSDQSIEIANVFYFHSPYFTRKEMFLSGVLPMAGLQVMQASCRDRQWVPSLFRHYSEALEYCQKNNSSLKGNKALIFNIPDIIKAIEFLLEQKEIQDELNTPSEGGATAQNVRVVTFTQEEFAKLLFSCRELGGEQGLALFEKYSEKIRITPAVFASILTSPCFDEIFEWSVSKWREVNAGSALPEGALSNVLTWYLKAIKTEHYGEGALSSEQAQAMTDALTVRLKRIMEIDPNQKLNIENAFFFSFITSLQADCLYGVLPLVGLQTIQAVCQDKLNPPLLDHYRRALQYCQGRIRDPYWKNSKIANLPEIINAVAFLLSQKEIQEHVSTLPAEETLEQSARWVTFTQEKFVELLLSCRELGDAQGRDIFEKNFGKIKVTAAILSSLISSGCSLETFHLYAENWISVNRGTEPSSENVNTILGAALKRYINAVGDLGAGSDKKTQAKQREEIADRVTIHLQTLVAVSPNLKWTITDRDFYSRVSARAEVLLQGVLPCQGLEIMASLRSGAFDISLLKHYSEALQYCQEGDTTRKDRKIANLPDIIEAVAFLLSQKEIQDQVSTLPAEETLEQNARGVTFSQEKLTKLLFSCRELGGEQGRVIFDKNAERIHVSTQLLTSMISSTCSEEAFQCYASTWMASNPGTKLPKETLSGVLRSYVSDIERLYYYQDNVSAEAVETYTKTFKVKLQRVARFPHQKGEMANGFCYRSPSETRIFLPGVLPFMGLQAMQECCPDEVNLSLLEHYSQALKYCEENSSTWQDKKLTNMPDIVNAIAFLLAQKGIQEQLDHLPKEETLADENAKRSTFTQEKLTQLLFRCRELGGEAGRVIFDAYSDRIQITTASLTDMILSPCAEGTFEFCASIWMASNPGIKLAKEVLHRAIERYLSAVDYVYSSGNDAEKIPGRLQKAAEDFTRYLNRILMVNKQITWEKEKERYVYGHSILPSSSQARLSHALSLQGLQIMASLSKDTFDVSLLEYYLSALEDYLKNRATRLQDKNVVNLPDILDAVEFLLSQKEIQEQLKALPKERSVQNPPAITQESFSRLLVLCEETGLEKGHAIFEENKSKMSVSMTFLTSSLSYISSKALFEWCGERWRHHNFNKQFPTKEMLCTILDHYINTINNLDYTAVLETNQKQIEIATKAFRSSLEKLYSLDNSIKWEKDWFAQHSHHRTIGERAVLLYGHLPLAGLQAMASLRSQAFDVSLLECYRSSLEYYRNNSRSSQDTNVINLPDILSAVEFLLGQKEIQEKINTLLSSDTEDYYGKFTQEKFAELLFFCREIGGEQGVTIFNQHESQIKVTASLLGSLALEASSEAFQNCIQRLRGGDLPAGMIGVLTRKYTNEREDALRNASNYSQDKKAEIEQKAWERFKLGLSRILEVSPQTSLVCRKKDFPSSLITYTNSDGSRYIGGILPVQAISLLKDSHVHYNPALAVSYLQKLASLESQAAEEHERSISDIQNYDAILETVQFLMGEANAKQTILAALETSDDLYAGFIAVIVLDLSEFYEPIYKKFCLRIQTKTPEVQKYELGHILETANKYKKLEAIKLLSSHPHVTITEAFLKTASETNYYEGLSCILQQKPALLNKIPISNTMLRNGNFEAELQGRLKVEAEKHGICEKELAELREVLDSMPDVYIPDMVNTLIRLARYKPLLPKHSVQEMIELEFGSSSAVWSKKGTHPEPKFMKNGESLLGSCYGFKPELYKFAVSKLQDMLSQPNLSLYNKRFCHNLAVLFPDETELHAYFNLLSSKETQDNTIWTIINEAANFKIPEKGYWNIERWFAFVKRNQFSHRAMSFLRSASDIEMRILLGKMIVSGYEQQADQLTEQPKTGTLSENERQRRILTGLLKNVNNNKAVLWDQLKKQCPLAYEHLIQSYLLKKLEKRRQSNSTESEEASLVTVRMEIEQELSKQKDNCALLLRKILEVYERSDEQFTVKWLVKLRLQDFPGLPKKHRDAVVTALENGYSNEDITKLITQIDKNKRPFTFVPSVVVEGSEIEDGSGLDYCKYELSALDPDDPMAHVAGLKTDCCQHPNGAGMEAAEHAASSVYSCIYRLTTKKNPNEGNWLAQAWTTFVEREDNPDDADRQEDSDDQCKSGEIILFDSIEYSGHAKEKMVLAAFKKLAEKLLEKNPHVKEIWVGSSQHARLKLEKYGYTRKLRDEMFVISGYSPDSYTDAGEIVVLLDRKTWEMRMTSEAVATQAQADVVIHVDSELKLGSESLTQEDLKQAEEETKVAQEETKRDAEYQWQIRYGVDTFLHPPEPGKPGKLIKLLGLSDEARELFNRKYARVMEFLRDDPQNPLVEEGFVSSDNDPDSRYREGEYSVTYEAVELWLEARCNPIIKEKGYKHQVYASTERHISQVLQEAKQNASIDTFSVVAIVGQRHAVSVFVDYKNSVSFILDSEPGSGLDHLKQALKDMKPGMRPITPPPDLRLQKDYQGCKPIAMKAVRFYAKFGEAFSDLLRRRSTEDDILELADMPAQLLKMTQTPLKTTEVQQKTIVSRKNAGPLNLLQYWERYQLVAGASKLNTAAAKTRLHIFEQLDAVLVARSKSKVPVK